MSSDRVFQLAELIKEMKAGTAPYYEFLRVPSLSCGIFRLPAGAKDLQAPHDEDEVYVVLEGRARIQVEGEEQPVQRGSILYVAAKDEHSFIEIEEDMTLVVFFATGGPG